MQIGNVALPPPKKEQMKYLGMNLDGRLTWEKHIKTKRHQLSQKAK
jgi:hypothetical protein